MHMIKWEPFQDMNTFFETPSPFGASPKWGWDLAADVYEEDDSIIATMTLPGIALNDLDVSVEHDMLIVSGRREEEEEVEKKDYYSKEIRRGLFSRSIPLPHAVNTAHSEARYENGELTIRMPILERAKRRDIRVKVA